MADFKDLIGKTLININIDNAHNIITFTTEDGSKYLMQHYQDCCESVVIEDIVGDIKDLLNTPILKASEDTNDTTHPEGITKDFDERFKWTFYNLATIKGYVTIRWYGSSNGYYSESVDFEKIT